MGPYDWAKDKASRVKQAVYPDPEKSRLKGMMETEEQERNFRTLNYRPPVQKAPPRLKAGKMLPKRSGGKY